MNVLEGSLMILESGLGNSARFCGILVGLMVEYKQVLEQVWVILMSFQFGYGEFLENGLGALLSLQPVGVEVCGEQLEGGLKDVAGLAGFLENKARTSAGFCQKLRE